MYVREGYQYQPAPEAMKRNLRVFEVRFLIFLNEG